MAENPIVSVVIPTYNRAHMVSRAIRSALAQDYPAMEVIIVDDGSTDGTSEVLDGFGSEIRSIKFEENRGGAAARNAGIEASRGEFVAFLDSDDEWMPNKTTRQLELMMESPTTGAVYCRHFLHDDSIGTRTERFPELFTGSIRPELFRGRCPHTVSLFMVRRAALDEVDGFDVTLSGFQDTDLWIRLAGSWEFDAVDEALVVFHEHSGPRVTRDVAAREKALDGFLEKWQEPMEEMMGVSGVTAYRRRNMAVAHGALVLSLVDEGKRGRALRELGRYLGVAGASNLKQAAGLVLACLFGTRVHSRVRAALRPRTS